MSQTKKIKVYKPKKDKEVRASRRVQNIHVFGQKDFRGWDNTISIYMDEQGQLIIEVEKPSVRCYEVTKVENMEGLIRITQTDSNKIKRK